MSVEAQRTEEIPDFTDFGLEVREGHEVPQELEALVGRVRELVEAAAHTEVPPQELASAAATVAEVTRKLGERSRNGGTLVRSYYADGLVRYNTMSNAVTGPANPLAPHLRFSGDGTEVSGETTLGGVYEGPPGCVHGGWVAALLDQAVGEAAWRTGSIVMTGKLSIDYRAPTPLHLPLRVTGRVEAQEGRKITVSGQVLAHGLPTAEASAVMVRIWPPKDGANPAA